MNKTVTVCEIHILASLNQGVSSYPDNFDSLGEGALSSWWAVSDKNMVERFAGRQGTCNLVYY